MGGDWRGFGWWREEATEIYRRDKRSEVGDI
jgi:hypothetical protein